MGKVGDNPYPGSRAFQQADRRHFFGRSAAAAVITDLWMTNRLTIVAGPAASGKTSLLRAGVYPLMRAPRRGLLPVGRPSLGMSFPFAAIPGHNPFTLGLLRSWAPDGVPARLAGLSVSDFVRRFAQGGECVTYAAVDQLDDLFLSSPSDAHARWRQRFFADLARACSDHPRLHLLLVARSEVVNHLTAAVGGGARHVIAGLTADEALEAITRPAPGAGRRFTADAAGKLVTDLLTARVVRFREERLPQGRSLVACHVEPSLLQVVCRRLWDDLPATVSEISEWAVREFGDVDMALAGRCGQVLSQVAAESNASAKDEDKVSPRELRSWLLDNFVTDCGTRGGAYEGGRSTAGLPNAVPRSLVDEHLLTAEIDVSVRRYRLLTNRLIEPLLLAHADRPAALTAAQYLALAERDMTQGELGCAAGHADRALRAAGGLRERAQAESLLGNVAYQQGKPGNALPHYKEAASLLQAAGDTSAAACQLAAAGQSLLAAGTGEGRLLAGGQVGSLGAALDG